MRNLLFLAIFFIFVYKATAVGSSSFYAEFTLTNREYGLGAQFPCKVWYDLASKNMRIDYFQPDGINKFMTVYYNYTSKDKYQICGTGATANCSRATWTTPQPPFQFTPPSLYSGPAAQCVTPDWNGPRACPTNCATYTANPAQPQGISSLSHIDGTAAAKLCLVRWTPGTGFTYGPEWHITLLQTSGYTKGSPTDVTTYSSVLTNVKCPVPTCFAEIDIALSIDESGSIGNNWPTVQNFVKGLIGSLDIRATGARVGLSYFSGIGDCGYNFTGTIPFASCTGGCGVCGGLWNTLTPEVSTNKANLIALADGHAHQKGYTCISCGVDQGIRILNAAPKANTQKLIILMTDGAQNMITDQLVPMANLAKAMKIDVIAVGVANYKLSDLQVIASNDKIYTSPDFAGLAGLIQQIITPLCQPLPSIDTCNFCSGLCSCQANCNCPTCNDYNACTNENCDIRPAPQGTGGVCVSTNVTCEDNNVCTQNLCSTSTGCYYTVPTEQPADKKNTFCKIYQCQNPQGFVQIDKGDTVCPPPANKCTIAYCNETGGAFKNGSCESIDRTLTPFGVAITYTNSAGQTFSTTGCGKKTGAFTCQQYSCNINTGACVEDNSACVCLKDSDCDDGNGCTTDRCDTTNNVCVRTSRDCWSDLSSGACVSIGSGQTTVAPNNATADNFYTNGPNAQALNSSGLPTPLQSRTCAELACYRGQRSTYTCQSTSSSTSQCVRTVTNCTSTGCVDNVCRPTGGWTSGQVNTACDVQKTITCTDGVACTRDDCNSGFSGVNCYTGDNCLSKTGARCNFVTVNSNCNDNDVCTSNICTSSGCTYPALPSQTPNLCFTRGCDPVTGNFSRVNTTACPQQANKCLVPYCVPSLNGGAGGCASLDRNQINEATPATYTDPLGNTVTVTGCKKPQQNGCINFSCDPATGLCISDSSQCQCVANEDCNDNNGCTIDVCSSASGTNKCVYTNYDCFSDVSNGGCTFNGGFTPNRVDNATGVANLDVGAPDIAFVKPTVGNTYTCNELGCYSGRRSTYTCRSTGDDSRDCVRTFQDCPRGGCTDSTCRTLATWTNGQIDTDCGALKPVDCSGKVDFCNSAVCNPTSLFSDTNRCIVTSTASKCNDGSECTIDTCGPTQCNYAPNTTTPTPNDNLCFEWQCSAQTGWIRVDKNSCQPTNGGCTISYCDSKANNGKGGCVSYNRTEVALGTTATYTDYAGNTISIPGCGRPAGDLLDCRKYLCDENNGQCYENTTTCQCISDSNCEDGNGCTIDKCVLATGTCSREYIDCWSELSNGACVSNINSAANNPIYPNGKQRPTPTTVDLNIDIGLAQYYGNFSNLGINFNLDANGLPSPNTGVSRKCAHLACYNGNPSTYTCFSTAENNRQCKRITTNCGRNGCQDNICRVPGGAWTAEFQQNSDCNTIFRPNCADKDSCTNDFCNTAWLPTDPADQRCIHTSLNETGQCDDGNFCTFDYCDSNDTSSNPCKHNLYNDRYVRKNLCKNGTRCDNVQCTVNRCIYTSLKCLPSNLCVFYKCNTSTNGTCAAFPTGLYKFDKCGVCGGNGLSCVIITPANPNRTSIAVALGVGLGVGLCLAAAIIAFLSKKSFDMYNAIGLEQQGTVTNNPTHQGGDDHIDTSHYN